MNNIYPTRSKQVAARMLGGEMMIMSAQNTSLFNLNDVGSLIWNASDGRTSLDEIIDKLCVEFDVTPEVARQDAESFIAELAGHGILLLNENPLEAK